ncbi:hypothetical protein MKQ70_36985 [Chitinophaga sedimenti]|uniref:RHS repeat domain-containing protein n=1 Tax=Chitinophaga sedimenti TaxID=2033606 RepID=UPI0020059A05|nr:RHS repeat-associated core domain-containing protein [Chitinophaga sedimenti]MCK7560208.1 hypothetical protein [Chitinophaga sedimenti]
MVVKESGFLYVYTSNETAQDVFFDNVVVTMATGPVLEETHYYPFGLAMSGISSKAIYNPENRYKFNGIELNSDFDLYSYEARYRNLDPQIGRWWQIDPKPSVGISPFASMDLNPILNSDF